MVEWLRTLILVPFLSTCAVYKAYNKPLLARTLNYRGNKFADFSTILKYSYIQSIKLIISQYFQGS